MTFLEYKKFLHCELAVYGFTSCPLTSVEIFQLHNNGIALVDAYAIACDANALQESFNVQDSINLIKES